MQSQITSPSYGGVCRVKNTFLELVEPEAHSPKHRGRRRSKSAGAKPPVLVPDLNLQVPDLNLLVPDLEPDKFTSHDSQSVTSGGADVEGVADSLTTIANVNGQGCCIPPPPSWQESAPPPPPAEFTTEECAVPCLQDATSDKEPLGKVQTGLLQALYSLYKLTDGKPHYLMLNDLITDQVATQLSPFVPVGNQGNLPSVGSILHAEGICKPCAFFTFLSKGRCFKKDRCMYCHFEHGTQKPMQATSCPPPSHSIHQVATNGYAKNDTLDGGPTNSYDGTHIWSLPDLLDRHGRPHVASDADVKEEETIEKMNKQYLEKQLTASLPTIASCPGLESRHEVASITPRIMKSPTSTTPPFSPQMSSNSQQSWISQSQFDNVLEEQPQVSSDVVEAVQKLTDVVVEMRLTREDLENDEVAAELYPFIPFDSAGNVTSLGSILHASGVCNPCSFIRKGRCHKRDLCVYCHLQHHIPLRPAPSLRKRRRAQTQRQKQQVDSDGERFRL